MKELVQKLKKSVQILIRIIIKFLQMLIISAMICFFVTSMLFISNIIMGVVVGFRYYFMLFSYGSMALGATLYLCNINSIFVKKKKVVRANVNRKTPNTKKQNRNIPKRKVS